MRQTAFHHDRVEVVILQPWVLRKEVTRVLVLVLMCFVSAGHTRSINAVSLRESTQSALLAHFLEPMRLNAETLSLKRSPPCCLGSIHLFLEVP
jgi:hypothetical protein